MDTSDARGSFNQLLQSLPGLHCTQTMQFVTFPVRLLFIAPLWKPEFDLPKFPLGGGVFVCFLYRWRLSSGGLRCWTLEWRMCDYKCNLLEVCLWGGPIFNWRIYSSSEFTNQLHGWDCGDCWMNWVHCAALHCMFVVFKCCRFLDGGHQVAEGRYTIYRLDLHNPDGKMYFSPCITWLYVSLPVLFARIIIIIIIIIFTFSELNQPILKRYLKISS